MAIRYSISDLFRLANNVRYIPEAGQALNRLLSANTELEYNVALQEATEILTGYNEFGRGVSGQLGLPIYMPVEFESFDGIVDNLLLDSAITGANRTKNIVITELQGNDSSVKEFINSGDWIVNISGILCKPGYGYPLDQVENFNAYMEQNKSLKIIHEKLNTLGIFELVIQDYDLPPSEFVNCQPFTITAISDQPIELELE